MVLSYEGRGGWWVWRLVGVAGEREEGRAFQVIFHLGHRRFRAAMHSTERLRRCDTQCLTTYLPRIHKQTRYQTNTPAGVRLAASLALLIGGLVAELGGAFASLPDQAEAGAVAAAVAAAVAVAAPVVGPFLEVSRFAGACCSYVAAYTCIACDSLFACLCEFSGGCSPDAAAGPGRHEHQAPHHARVTHSSHAADTIMRLARTHTHSSHAADTIMRLARTHTHSSHAADTIMRLTRTHAHAPAADMSADQIEDAVAINEPISGGDLSKWVLRGGAARAGGVGCAVWGGVLGHGET